MASKKYHQASTVAQEEMISNDEKLQLTEPEEYEDSDDEETNDENEITSIIKRAKSSTLANFEHQEGTQQQKSQRSLKPKKKDDGSQQHQ